MSEDSVTVRSSQSWLGRLGGSIAGVLFGVILFLAAFVVLSWNEGRAIRRAQTLAAGSKAVISVPASPVDPANDGKLIHITGETAAEGPVDDPVFGIKADAIKLRRNVEMYQWTEEKKTETQKNLGGSEETVTTYSYSKKWSAELINSDDFHKPEGHANPSQMPVEGTTFAAEGITVGAFTLSDSLIDKLDDYSALPVTKNTTGNLSDDVPGHVQVADHGYYVGDDPQHPVVGDLRVHFQVVKPGTVSIVAAQVGETFEPYVVSGLGEIELLQTGNASAANMFASEQQGNAMLTWLLRLAGFVMMFFGLVLIGNPVAVLADVVPIFGSVAETGISLIAFAIALPLSLGTIALAWLAYRPLIGLPLAVAALASVYFGWKKLRRKKPSPSQETPPPLPTAG